MTEKTAKKTTKKKATKKKKAKNYINNKDLLAEVIKSKEQGKMTDKLGHMILLLVKRYSSQPCYTGYTYVEDMESHALMTVCKVWNSFKPEKSNNPFAYFTQTIKHSFWQYLEKEENHRDIRDKMLLKEGELPSHTYLDKYAEKEFNIEFTNSIKQKKPTETFSGLLDRLTLQLVGSKSDDTYRKRICERVESEMFDYELEKKTPYKYISEEINKLCAEIDPTYRTLSTDEYFDELEGENDDETNYDE